MHLEAVTGVMWPQPRNAGMSGAGRGKEGFSPKASGGSRGEACLADTLILDCWPPELREEESLLL